MLTHLLTREITDTSMFMAALDRMGKLEDPMFGTIESDDTLDVVFNLSKGDDHRGPWNSKPTFRYVPDPKPTGDLPPAPINPDDEKTMPLAAE